MKVWFSIKKGENQALAAICLGISTNFLIYVCSSETAQDAWEIQLSTKNTIKENFLSEEAVFRSNGKRTKYERTYKSY